MLSLSRNWADLTLPLSMAEATTEVLTALYPLPPLAYWNSRNSTTSRTTIPRTDRFRSIKKRPFPSLVPRVGPSRPASCPADPRRGYRSSQRHVRLPFRLAVVRGYLTVHRSRDGRHQRPPHG